MTSWYKIEAIFANKNVPPSELRNLEFYSIQLILKEWEEQAERENKEVEKQQKEMEKQQKSMKSGFGNFSTPKFEMPKYNMPK